MLRRRLIRQQGDAGAFFEQSVRALKPSGHLLIAEPRFHVSEIAFAATVRAAGQAGLSEEARPTIPGTRSILLARAGLGPGILADQRLLSEPGSLV